MNIKEFESKIKRGDIVQIYQGHKGRLSSELKDDNKYTFIGYSYCGSCIGCPGYINLIGPAGTEFFDCFRDTLIILG